MSSDLPPPFSLVPAALDRFSALVHAVPPDRWDAPTPCEAWTVRDLVNHVTAEHLWAPHLLAGETLEQVGDRYDGDVLGDDPVAAWDAAAAASRAAWLAVDPTREVHLSFGLSPAALYGDQMLLDLVVHGWDLARGARVPDPGAAPEAVARARASIEGQDLTAWGDLFAPPVATGSDDPEDQLAGLVGRDPARWPRT